MEGMVLLDVVVGEGQMGSIRVLLDGELKHKGDNEIRKAKLGPAEDVEEQELTVTAVVSPVNPATRRTSLTCIFRSDAGEAWASCSDPDHGDELVRFEMAFSRD